MNKKKKELSDEKLRIRNFYKRWNIELSDQEKWDAFRERVLNAYAETVGPVIRRHNALENQFHNLLGIHIKKVKGIFDLDISYDDTLIKSPVYNYFLDITDSKKLLLAIEAVVWMEDLDWDVKIPFIEQIEEAVVITAVPLEIVESGNDILFYPAGAKLLDSKLVNDNLEWLSHYPDAYNSFKIALLEVGKKKKERHVVDSLRLSLELFLKTFLKNNKSLENQKTEIGKFLKDTNTSPEISNLFWQILDYYSKYQNGNVKHADSVNPNEVEFILYLTGTLLRFLLTR